MSAPSAIIAGRLPTYGHAEQVEQRAVVASCPGRQNICGTTTSTASAATCATASARPAGGVAAAIAPADRSAGKRQRPSGRDVGDEVRRSRSGSADGAPGSRRRRAGRRRREARSTAEPARCSTRRGGSARCGGSTSVPRRLDELADVEVDREPRPQVRAGSASSSDGHVHVVQHQERQRVVRGRDRVACRGSSVRSRPGALRGWRRACHSSWWVQCVGRPPSGRLQRGVVGASSR